MAKHKVGERQIGRILALIANEALSGAEISARLYMCKTSVTRFLAILLKEKRRRLHIADWREADIGKPTRLFRAGSEKDAPYTPKRNRRKQDQRIIEADRRRAEVLTLLAMPQTSRQLAARMRISTSTVMAYIREHREAGRVHIKGWVLPAEQGSQSPVYALGNAPDKPRTRGSRRRVPRKPMAAWAPMLTTLLVREAAQDHLPQAA